MDQQRRKAAEVRLHWRQMRISERGILDVARRELRQHDTVQPRVALGLRVEGSIAYGEVDKRRDHVHGIRSTICGIPQSEGERDRETAARAFTRDIDGCAR